MKPRLTGTEMEFGLLVQRYRGSSFADNDATVGQAVLEHVPDYLSSMSTYLSNGGRSYLDSGSHIEYATPEDTSIEGTVANEIAGERIVYQSLVRACEAEDLYDFSLNKRVIDDSGVTWGHHTSFSADKRKVIIDAREVSRSEKSMALLGLHLATVNIFTGAGVVLQTSDGKKGRFAIAQKALRLAQDYSGTTVSNKPLINLRDEPHSNGNLARVHLTSGDANMSPWAMRMRLGTISLILRMIEENFKSSRLDFQDRLYILARHVAVDLTFMDPVETDAGLKIRPSEIQESLVEGARKLKERVELSEEELTSLAMWETALTDFQKDPYSLDRSDWGAKKKFLEDYMAKKRIGWEDPRVANIDKLWGKISDDGIGIRLRQGAWNKWMPDEDLITDRMQNAPETTRARLRGGFIARFAGVKGDFSASWTHVAKGGRKIMLMDPYNIHNNELEELIAA